MSHKEEQPETVDKPEVRLAPETIDYLEEKMRTAVRDGIAGALTDENARRFFSTGLSVIREEAATHTGRFVIDGLVSLAKKVLWIAIFVAAVYSMGGWHLVKTIGAAVFAGAKGSP